MGLKCKNKSMQGAGLQYYMENYMHLNDLISCRTYVQKSKTEGL